ncbi:hypothetical protein [Kitasatospora sp. NBC_01302]|uniref:hypothetical protein n=1 Tax=Kitasatospora sp. NBC_01302 TaxID=2903575 RepID=UPI002E0F010C|nr:hypothetical protein OG294_14350 [Kitasatospora sp. NBC_01302]
MRADPLLLAAERIDTPPVNPFDGLNFTPNPGPQSTFLSLPDENLDVLYGGAAGGSKSTSLLMYGLRACYRWPGLQAFWFRRSFPELEQSVLRMLARYNFARALGGRYNGSTHELRFSNGSVFTFGHAKNISEVSALQSAEINLLLIDERTTIPPDVVDQLYVRVRSGVAGVPCLGIRSATNPGGIGHSRVRAEYVDATGHGEREIEDGNGRRRIFIQARVSDTPQLGDEYKRNLQGLDEKIRKAYLEGDWGVFAGQAFSEWRYDRHVVQPVTVPTSWRRFAGVDWGYTAPWAVLWGAVDEDDRVWIYRELYATQVAESEQAKRIVAAEEGEAVAARYADDAMWASRGEAKPIATVYSENGAHLTAAGKGPGSRISGWQRVHSYLAEAPACPHHRALGWETCPRLHVFPQAENLIRTLPSLPHATVGNPEDIDTKAEDHAPDALRYLLINLGGGPSFPLFDAPEGNEELDQLLQALGPTVAYRPREDPGTDPWDEQDEPQRGTTRPSPFV